jgi:hypothetical protein
MKGSICMDADAKPQTPRESSRLPVRSLTLAASYGATVAPSAMARFLAIAAKEMREAADRRRYEVSSSATDRVDPSTLYRFEKGRWPENPDRLIDLYASDLAVEPIAIWERALALWQAAERRGATGEDELPEAGVLPDAPGPLPGPTHQAQPTSPPAESEPRSGRGAAGRAGA